MNKVSYVSIERGVCVVCGQSFHEGTLMIEHHLAADSCVLGWELCTADARLHRLGFVALVECAVDMRKVKSGDAVLPHEVTRTGGVMHVTRESFVAIFRTEAKAGLPCAYVPEGTLQRLQQMMQQILN